MADLQGGIGMATMGVDRIAELSELLPTEGPVEIHVMYMDL
jgi:hypothetical protein